MLQAQTASQVRTTTTSNTVNTHKKTSSNYFVYLYSNIKPNRPSFLQPLFKAGGQDADATGADRLPGAYYYYYLYCKHSQKTSLKVPFAPKWFDFELPIIKTTKLLVETRSCAWSEFTRSGQLVAAGHL